MWHCTFCMRDVNKYSEYPTTIYIVTLEQKNDKTKQNKQTGGIVLKQPRFLLVYVVLSQSALGGNKLELFRTRWHSA